MLRYTVKPLPNTGLTTFPFEEFYVSSDGTYISGITDYSIGLYNNEKVLVKSPFLKNGSEFCTLLTENAVRQGKVEVNAKLEVKTITKTLNFSVTNDEETGESYIEAFNTFIEIGDDISSGSDEIYSSITQNYVSYDGNISYFFEGEDENSSGYLINGIFYKAARNDKYVTIKDYFYIDDGKLVVGDNIYYADFSKLSYSNVKPELKLSRYAEPLQGGDYLGVINGIEYSASTENGNELAIDNYTQKEWKTITKFVISKKQNQYLEIDDVLSGKYKHYIVYDDKNYFLKEYSINDEVEYGVLIDGMFYADYIFHNNDINVSTKNELILRYRNGEEILGHYVDSDMLDKTFEVKNNLVISDRNGTLLVIVLHNEKSDINVGDIILAESKTSYYINREVKTDEIGTNYIDFLGKKYQVEKKLFDTVNVSGNDYKLVYTDESYSSATASIMGDVTDFIIRYFTDSSCNNEVTYLEYESSKSSEKCVKATIDRSIFYNTQTTGSPTVRYGMHNNAYVVTENSGVTINNTTYKVNKGVRLIDGDNESESYYVGIDSGYNFRLRVSKINGSSTLICYPYVDDKTYNENDFKSVQQEIVDIISSDSNNFNFRLLKIPFGDETITAEDHLAESMSTRIPFTTSNIKLLEKDIEIYRQGGYFLFRIPFMYNTANNILKEDIISNEFVDYSKDNSINRIVDMEKDVYYPVCKLENEYNNIKEIRFNLHFRTRGLDNWKVIEDDREREGDETYNSLMCNWFATDYSYYNDPSTVSNQYAVSKKYLHNSSDLLGYLNFSNSEIFNGASKIGKSFLRLSFYSTNNPQTQVLLGTSTVFFDEELSRAKYLSLKKNSDLMFIDTSLLQKEGYSGVSSYISDADKALQVSSYTTNAFSEVMGDIFLNDAYRLSSRFTIKDKYNTKNSSEGFYLYMFKEYSKKNFDGVIYMRVDFNHAGIGQSIPFMLPRKISSADDVGTPLYLFNKNDVEILKKGFKTKDIYKQLYIPINIIYDMKTNRYVYYLPNRIRENEELGVSNEIMEFNLFEVKFANESIIYESN